MIRKIHDKQTARQAGWIHWRDSMDGEKNLKGSVNYLYENREDVGSLQEKVDPNEGKALSLNKEFLACVEGG